MIMSSFLKSRKSVREFRKKKINDDNILKINLYIEAINTSQDRNGTRFKFIEDGSNLYEKLKDLGGYSGVMIESPHYISLRVRDNGESLINGAYHMESIISKLNKLGLDTCWISLDSLSEDEKNKIFEKEELHVEYLLALGYAKLKNPFATESLSDRKNIEEIVFNETIDNNMTVEELENRGLEDIFYYVRYAPSNKNKQPWRFIVDKTNKVTLLLEKSDDLSLVDGGIIMYYFKTLAETMGINNDWDLINKEDTNYQYIGEFQL